MVAAVELDAFDRKILRELVQDARISQLVLAERVGLSPTACTRRLHQLEKRRVITVMQPRSTPPSSAS